MTTRELLLGRIAEERSRQESLFGSEWDGRHGPNDWIALIAHYASESVQKHQIAPARADFEATLVKAAAVALAALEYADHMVGKGKLVDKPGG